MESNNGLGDKEMNFIPTAMSFCIELTKEDFLKIMEVDSKEENEGNWDNTLFQKLDKIDGIVDVDYNGHFGANIWLQMDLEFSIREMAEKIKKIVKEHINGKQ